MLDEAVHSGALGAGKTSLGGMSVPLSGLSSWGN
jgi:hypothetical protein